METAEIMTYLLIEQFRVILLSQKASYLPRFGNIFLDLLESGKKKKQLSVFTDLPMLRWSKDKQVEIQHLIFTES